MRLDIPDDVVIHSPMTALAVRNLDVGDYVKVQTFNPVTLAKETATVRALLRETITLDEGPVQATKLEIEYMGGRSHAWVDDEGQLLRQETPIGWTLEKCHPDQVFEEEEDATTKDTKGTKKEKKTTTETQRHGGEGRGEENVARIGRGEYPAPRFSQRCPQGRGRKSPSAQCTLPSPWSNVAGTVQVGIPTWAIPATSSRFPLSSVPPCLRGSFSSPSCSSWFISSLSKDPIS
jgi:hypothetical protein